MFKNILLISVFISIIIISVIFYFKYEIQDQKINFVLDQSIVVLDTQIKEKQMDALQLATVLSRDMGLVNALENDDEDLGYKILSTTLQSIGNNTGRFIRAQIITSEYNIFARSWDDIYAGMPLADYRTDLNYFKTNRTSRTSIEIGRRLGIKATVPIYMDDTLLGFVEVISFFEPITDFFRNLGIDLYVLMNQKHLDIAVFMRDNIIVDEYVLANTNYNHANMKTLANLNFKELKANRIIETDDQYIFYETMSNGASEVVGAYLFILPKKYLQYFRDPEDDISFLINISRSSLYNVVKTEEYKNNIYNKENLESLLYYKDIVSKEEKKELIDAAYEKLDIYTKDELIQYILEKKVVKKIDGKIK